MKQSQLFSKTRKEAPKDEVSKNAQLLIRAGFIHKEMAGVYAYLPLGLRVLNKINAIIREEMNAIGGQELILTALQDKTLWEKTDRWDDSKVDNWFKTSFSSGGETGLGITHEEPLTRVMTKHISSYRDLPIFAYQFQTKFRNELRAKSGIMRGKEFLMKDLYSFSQTEEEHLKMYNKAREAYKRIFSRVGIGEITYVTFASGGIFSEFSEEFQTVSDAGEDIIYVSEEKGIAINKEILTDEVLQKLNIRREELIEKKSIESGNIFHLGTKFSQPLDLKFKDENEQDTFVIMGSYGLGPTRLMGTLVECFADDKGIVWPEAVAPFRVHLISLSQDEEAEKIYQKLTDAGVEVLFDDRDMGAGAKFADSDLIGIPYRVVVGKKSLEQGGVEVKGRKEETGVIMTVDALLEKLK
jgi:prolyl-tRNA synthetase